MVSTCSFQLCKIRKIRHLLTQAALIQVVIALVLSHLDFANANSIYLGLPLFLSKRLQMVQNQAARLIHRQPRWQSARPLLEKLNWLPICQRSAFKSGCLIFKSLHYWSPKFINCMLSKHRPSRNLRSGHLQLLTTPVCSLKRHGGSRFAYLALRLWNSFPSEIRSCTNLLSFRKQLKTWLFRQAYE